jgi:hypothetical protein
MGQRPCRPRLAAKRDPPKQWDLRAGVPPFRAGVAAKHQLGSKLAVWERNSLTVQEDGRSILAGARDRWCTMRDEFASKSFLAVTVAGLVLLCSGLFALAFA